MPSIIFLERKYMNTYIKTGNILDVTEGVIVQGCNMQGKMNKGLAKLLRERYPDNYEAYMTRYYDNALMLGDVIFHRVNDRLYIANAITQRFYGNDPNVRYVDYNAVKNAFKLINEFANEKELSVYFPKIGGGLGNGDWDVISDMIKVQLNTVKKSYYVKLNIGE